MAAPRDKYFDHFDGCFCDQQATELYSVLNNHRHSAI